jgi:hypothetical protein
MSRRLVFVTIGIVLVNSVALSGCTTYELRAGDFNRVVALPTNDPLVKQEQTSQPWYSGVTPQFFIPDTC